MPSTLLHGIYMHKSHFNLSQARAWLAEHGYNDNQLEKFVDTYYFRQMSKVTLNRLGYRKYRSRNLGNGVVLVFGVKN
jgi:hypothetical protein